MVNRVLARRYLDATKVLGVVAVGRTRRGASKVLEELEAAGASLPHLGGRLAAASLEGTGSILRRGGQALDRLARIVGRSPR
jgi:hypothetical protein